jgi:hypothetical protein
MNRDVTTFFARFLEFSMRDTGDAMVAGFHKFMSPSHKRGCCDGRNVSNLSASAALP